MLAEEDSALMPAACILRRSEHATAGSASR